MSEWALQWIALAVISFMVIAVVAWLIRRM
jgi:hypothetical protein